MKKLILGVGLVAISTGAYAANSDYDYISGIIGNCVKIFGSGSMDDYLVRCDETDELVSISKKDVTAKFISATADLSAYDMWNASPDGTIIINVAPGACNNGTLGYLFKSDTFTWEDVYNLPENQMWAVVVCP